METLVILRQIYSTKYTLHQEYAKRHMQININDNYAAYCYYIKYIWIFSFLKERINSITHLFYYLLILITSIYFVCTSMGIQSMHTGVRRQLTGVSSLVWVPETGLRPSGE